MKCQMTKHLSFAPLVQLGLASFLQQAPRCYRSTSSFISVSGSLQSPTLAGLSDGGCSGGQAAVQQWSGHCAAWRRVKVWSQAIFPYLSLMCALMCSLCLLLSKQTMCRPCLPACLAQAMLLHISVAPCSCGTIVCFYLQGLHLHDH